MAKRPGERYGIRFKASPKGNGSGAGMGPASDKLKSQKWSDALEPENKLCSIYRAPWPFRDIQVSRGQQGGGGGGGGGAVLGVICSVRLELIRRISAANAASSSSGDKQQQAGRSHGGTGSLATAVGAAEAEQQAAGQRRSRWEQEQLRRELEDLKQLSRVQQQQQQSGQQLAARQQQPAGSARPAAGNRASKGSGETGRTEPQPADSAYAGPD
jgi:hypothetical protein